MRVLPSRSLGGLAAAAHSSALAAVVATLAVVSVTLAAVLAAPAVPAAPASPLPGYRLETVWPAAAHGLPSPTNLAAGLDGRVWLLDAQAGQVVAMAPDGTVNERRPARKDALDLSPDPSGDLFMGLWNGKPIAPHKGFSIVGRYRKDGSEAWFQNCECATGTGVSVSSGRVWFTDPKSKSMTWLGVSDGRVTGKVTSTTPGVGFPADLATAPDGTLFATDLVGGAVYAWPPPYLPNDFTQWPVVESNGPFRIGVGAQADGEVLVAVLHTNGLVRVHRPDGTLVARFYVPGDPGDITVGQGGRLYLLDEASHEVRVYVPGPPPTPTPLPADPPITRASCQITGTKTLAPASLNRCSRTEVHLQMAAVCPPGAVPGADIVLVVDESQSMRLGTPGGPFRIDGAREAAHRFLAGLDFRYHQVALLGFSDDVVLEQKLTTDRALLDAAVDRLLPQGAGTNIYAAVRAASDHIATAGRPNTLPVIILLTDGEPSLPKAPEPSTAAFAAAERARSRRTYIVTIGLGQFIDSLLLEGMASTPQDFYYAPNVVDLNHIYDTIGKVLQNLNLTDLVIEDTPSSRVRYVPGSGAPPPLVVNDTLTWFRPGLPREGLTFSYTVSAQLPGRGPAGAARVRFTDADGTRRTFRFPEPELNSILPTETPGPAPTVDPNEPTPGGPTPLPTLPLPPPAPVCASRDSWYLSLVVFPDTVGFGGYNCPGCNGRYDQGDHWERGAGASAASTIVVTDLTGQALWVGTVQPQANGPARTRVRLCASPPYVITLARIPAGYMACPNSPPSRTVDGRSFGFAHSAEVSFGVWAGCGLPTPVPATPAPRPTALPACPE